MSGEKDLLKLLENLSPSMSEDEYIFCTFQDSTFDNFTDLEPFASVKEKEGMSKHEAIIALSQKYGVLPELPKHMENNKRSA